MRCLRLPFTFDPEKLRADLALVRDDEWIAHVQRSHYDGHWSGAQLRAPGGDGGNVVPDALGGEAYGDTPLLARCAYFRTVLAAFRCPLKAVRLLRLHAGSSIAEHVDNALDFDDGEIRIHIPIQTSAGVHFILDGARLIMAPGECWYTNVNLPHSVANHGPGDRIHLVLDCVVDAWLREVFRTTPRGPLVHHTALLNHRAPAHQELESLAALAPELGTAGQPVRFRSASNHLCLNWVGAVTWQIRARSAPTDDGRTLTLESSADPAGARRADFARVVAQLAERLGAQVA